MARIYTWRSDVEQGAQLDGYTIIEYQSVGLDGKPTSHDVVTLQCTQGHEYTTIAHDFVRGKRCQVCHRAKIHGLAKQRADESKRKVSALLEHEGYTINGWGKVRNTAKSSVTSVEFTCFVGHRGSMRANVVIKGMRCNACGMERTRQSQLFESRSKCVEQVGQYTYVGVRFDVEVEEDGTRTQYISYTCPEGHTNRREAVGFIANQKCKGCARTGFKDHMPGHLYLFARWTPDGFEYQYGITNQLHVRTLAHQRNGWELIDAVWFLCGADATNEERAIRKRLKFDGIPHIDDTCEGFTETYRQCDLPIDNLADLLTWAAQPAPVLP